MKTSMQTLVVLLCLSSLFLLAVAKEKDVTELQIEVTHKPEGCDEAVKSKAGDRIHVHYTGMLTDGSKFDSSLDRGTPFAFKLGGGQVIKGWDQGLLGACVGEKRTLRIPPELGYGQAGAGGRIPGGATLIFETEVMKLE